MEQLVVKPSALVWVKSALSKVEEAQQDLRHAKMSFILSSAPVKIGDRIPVTGFSHEGKEMVVESVHLQAKRSYRDPEVVQVRLKAVGKVLKKDGTPGLQSGESYWEVEAEENT